MRREIEMKIIENRAEKLVEEIRDELIKEYPNNILLTGKCLEASDLFRTKWNDRYNDFSCDSSHGELTHSPMIKSKNWSLQHEMNFIRYGRRKLWVDCTAGQFQDIIHDVPVYYIGWKKPRWFYPDKQNPEFGNFRKVYDLFNCIVKIKVSKQLKVPIISYLRYYVFGYMCDFINQFLF